tara:strand:+ start:14360 stop:15517 length:1158 start_codon:yes stop_codon:yes gene_type:complete
MSNSELSDNSDANPDLKPEARSFGNKFVLKTVLILLLVSVSGIGVISWYLDQINNIHVVDARIDTEMKTISSSTAGNIISLNVKEGDKVKSGDLLLKIDDREAKIELRELKYLVDGKLAQIRQIESQIRMLDRRRVALVVERKSELTAAKAEFAARELNIKLAKDDFYRADSLKKRGVVSIKKWRLLKTRVEMKNQEARKAAAKVKVAEAALRSAEITRDEIDVLRHELSRQIAQKEHLVAKIDGKKIQIDETNIISPIDGVIDKSFISSGEMAQSGQRLFLMHDPSHVWIEANIKETRLRNLKLGQLVSVQVDAYPNQIYSGKLVSIGDATTSQFALLPAPNPSGNFTKVTQRIPVRIEIKQRSNHLRPGMMVELDIEIDADDG